DFALLFQDAKEVQKIKTRMITNSTDYQKLPYREMEKLRQFRRDMIKAIPLVIISIPPFANYLVFVLILANILLPPNYLHSHLCGRDSFSVLPFIALRDVANNSGAVRDRSVPLSPPAPHSPLLDATATDGVSGFVPLAEGPAPHHAVLDGLERTQSSVQDHRLKSHLKNVCLCLQVRSGAHPVVSDVHAVRPLFSGPPLGIKRLYADQKRHLCPMLFLTARLPAFWIGRRLNSHALELMQLDRAIVRLGLHQLSDVELREAFMIDGPFLLCYLIMEKKQNAPKYQEHARHPINPDITVTGTWTDNGEGLFVP
ncbi:hypothetical protein NFI96_015488, partial [Prochilodus magdalenae]